MSEIYVPFQVSRQSMETKLPPIEKIDVCEDLFVT
jgi:hypothetical protein